MTAAQPEEWAPGDPMYDRGAHPHSNYLYCFRDDSAGENCNCADRADWPNPTRAELEPGDELGDFIAEVRNGAA